MSGWSNIRRQTWTSQLHRQGHYTEATAPSLSSLDFWRQCGAMLMISVCQHHYDDFIQTGKSMVFQQRPACQSLLKHPGFSLAMLFKYKLVSPHFKPLNFMSFSQLYYRDFLEHPTASITLFLGFIK